MAGRVAVVAVLGITKTIAWASSYYMPAILGAPIATALHLPTSMFFGRFSAALLLSAVIGPSVGRLIDRHGGRVLLACSNLVIATGLVILASAHGIIGVGARRRAGADGGEAPVHRARQPQARRIQPERRQPDAARRRLQYPRLRQCWRRAVPRCQAHRSRTSCGRSLPAVRAQSRLPGARGCVCGHERGCPSSRSSFLTPCWREVDSNCRSLPGLGPLPRQVG